MCSAFKRHVYWLNIWVRFVIWRWGWCCRVWGQIILTTIMDKCTGLILHGGNEGDCLHVPWSLPWCPWNAPVEIYNVLKGCPLLRWKCLGACAFSTMKYTDLLQSVQPLCLPLLMYSTTKIPTYLIRIN